MRALLRRYIGKPPPGEDEMASAQKAVQWYSKLKRKDIREDMDRVKATHVDRHPAAQLGHGIVMHAEQMLRALCASRPSSNWAVRAQWAARGGVCVAPLPNQGSSEFS